MRLTPGTRFGSIVITDAIVHNVFATGYRCDCGHESYAYTNRLAAGAVTSCTKCRASIAAAKRAELAAHHPDFTRADAVAIEPKLRSIRARTRRLIARGVIAAPAHCERCPQTYRVAAHHEDYTRPERVMFLCDTCHRARHRELASAGRSPYALFAQHLAWALAAVLTGYVLAGTAHAHDRGLDLARAAVHEAGLEAHADEVAAIHAVAVARCHGSVRCQMPRFFSGRTTRPWSLWLRRDGSRPWGWPSAAAWPRFAARWLAILAAADRVVAGEIAHRCEAEPEAWGGAVDRERARRMRLVEVDCGETRNAFYVFPRGRETAGGAS